MQDAQNGDHVTWRELHLVFDPIERRLGRIEKGIGILLEERNERRGAAGERRRRLDSRRFVIATLAVLAAALLTCVGAIFGILLG